MDAQPITRRSLVVVAVLSTAVLLACSQGAGETCQQNRDCEDGLICLPARGGLERSVCGTPDEANIDAGGGEGEPMLPPDDAGAGDAALDAGGDPGEQDAGDDPADVDAG